MVERGIVLKRIREIYSYREMIYSLVKRELRGRYQRSVLGLLWTMLNPLFQILVYTIIFTFVFPNNIPEYHLYLMTGLIPWTFFNESLIEGASSVIVNGDLTRKIYFPRDVLAISKVTSKFVNFILSLIVVFAFLIFSNRGISIKHLIYLPIIMIIEYLMCLGFALFFSAITVYFRDMEYIVGVIMMAWVWGTPIMYDASIIQNEYVKLLLNINPMTGIINAYHQVLYHQQTPSIQQLCTSLLAAVIVLVIGEVIFVKLEANFAEEL